MYKLLIADDEALEREALRYFVEHSNLEINEIIEASNGTDTVKKVMLEKPDIILLDINMPGLNGLESMERIQIGNPNCKVIFSTAFDYFEYAVKALQLGAIDFMVKPVKKERLIGVLNKAIDQLDVQLQQQTQDSRIKEIVELMGNRIIGELITGNITEEVLYYLETMDIGTVCYGNCFCIRVGLEYSKECKKEIIKAIKQGFMLMGFVVLINWKNATITLLVFDRKNTDKDKLTTIIQEILFTVLKKNTVQYIAGIGTDFEDVSQIEQSYNHARVMVGDIAPHTEEQGCLDDLAVSIKKISEFIAEHYREKISLEDIAKMVGYSKYHIGRLFKQYMGTTIVDYLIQVRMGKARELLKQGNYSIKQISEMVGYSDSNYFTWTFKKLEGVSPVKYRYSKVLENI